MARPAPIDNGPERVPPVSDTKKAAGGPASKSTTMKSASGKSPSPTKSPTSVSAKKTSKASTEQSSATKKKSSPNRLKTCKAPLSLSTNLVGWERFDDCDSDVIDPPSAGNPFRKVASTKAGFKATSKKANAEVARKRKVIQQDSSDSWDEDSSSEDKEDNGTPVMEKTKGNKAAPTAGS
eukprot:6192319-Pleurochrysis_carterae.AAC.1